MTASQTSSSLSVPLLSNPRLGYTTHDPQSWAEAIRVTTPVRICEPLQQAQPFRNTSAVLDLGTVMLLASEGSAITVDCDDHPAAQLLIPYAGQGWWHADGSVHTNHTGESVLYMPPAPLRLNNTTTSGVALYFNPSALVTTAITMAGPEGLRTNLSKVLQQPVQLLLSNPHIAHLIQGLYGLLSTLDQLMLGPAIDARQLRFDDVFTRLLLLLLLPELQDERASTALPASTEANRHKLQPLQEWIEAHLDGPIGLSELEAQANWSCRTLQYAFRSAYGCTPMQWVRRRRLEKAMQRLKAPLPGDSVSSISRSVGFVNPVSFSREFRRLFGCTPSSMFRV